MHESPEELVEHLSSLLQAKVGIEVHFDEPLLHKIHYSAHHREECDLSGKEICQVPQDYIF